MIQNLVLVAIILCFVLMFNRRSKVPKGQVSMDPLSGTEKLYIWIICLFNSIIGGAILYYGWKNRLPQKAKSANHISMIAYYC